MLVTLLELALATTAPRRKPSASSSPLRTVRANGALVLSEGRCCACCDHDARRHRCEVSRRAAALPSCAPGRCSSFYRRHYLRRLGARRRLGSGRSSRFGSLGLGRFGPATRLFFGTLASLLLGLQTGSLFGSTLLLEFAALFGLDLSALRLTKVFFLRTSTLMVLLPPTFNLVVVLRCNVILRGSSTLPHGYFSDAPTGPASRYRSLLARRWCATVLPHASAEAVARPVCRPPGPVLSP